MPMRLARQPGLDLRRLVGGVVVHDDMHARTFGHLPVDPPKKAQELGGAMPFVALPDHDPCSDIQRGKKQVVPWRIQVVGSRLGHARSHGQSRLFPIQRLDLGFLIYTQHDSPVGWRQIEPHDILHLVHEQRISRKLDRPGV